VNLALAVASAVFLILLFPPFQLTGFAPIALAPLLIACAREASWKRRWLWGWASGFVFWCGVCPWIQFVLEVHGGMGKWGGWGGYVLFGLYKGLHMAVFATLAGWLMHRWWALPGVAALWTGIERTHGYFGFAWLDLGNAGINMPLPMRLAPITGVYGLSFVFALLGCAVAIVVVRVMGQRRSRLELAWLLVLVTLLLLPRGPRPAAASHKALLVQPNLDTELVWTDDELKNTEQKLALLSRARGADLIIWPEVPAPFYANDPEFRGYAAGIARASETPFLLGVVGMTAQRQPLNSAMLLSPSGVLVDRYDKINLVPFGEFIPPLFGWVNRITHEAGDFVPGTRMVIFPVDGHKAATFICYESAFPDLVRSFVHSGAEVLVNLSNDGYFGHSAAHQQHLEIVRMRAAENRRWILRATNDGITAAIDPRGRVIDPVVPFAQTASLLPFDYSQAETLYTRTGDWFAWGCFALALLLLCGYGLTSGESPAHRRP
jgi:apolipoprotein N-acyltransferase